MLAFNSWYSAVSTRAALLALPSSPGMAGIGIKESFRFIIATFIYFVFGCVGQCSSGGQRTTGGSGFLRLQPSGLVESAIQVEPSRVG